MDITWKRKWIFWLLLAVMLLFLPGKTFAAEKERREAEDSYIYHTAFDAKASLKIRHMKDYGVLDYEETVTVEDSCDYLDGDENLDEIQAKITAYDEKVQKVCEGMQVVSGTDTRGIDGDTINIEYEDTEENGQTVTTRHFYQTYKIRTDWVLEKMEISDVNIVNSTLSCYAGDDPKATAQKDDSDDSKYEIAYERWEKLETNAQGYLEPVAFWYSDESQYIAATPKFTTFESGAMYMYSVFLKTVDGNEFSKDLSLTLNGKQIDSRTIIVGNNGTGKSTFIKILMGQVAPDSGTVDVGETVRFGYYSQDGLQFDEQMKVIDVVQDIAEVIELGNGKKLTASQFLQHFLFTPETQHSYVYKLSGGERRRLYLCTILMRNPNFLVLDEPTNDLDIITLNVLEEYLQNFKGCVIVVSHDRYFMDKVVDHLMVFNGQGDIRDFPGNYSDYRDWKDAKAQKEKEAEKPQEEKTARVRLNDKRKMSFKEKREFEQLEKEIAELETEKAQIEELLCSGTLSVDELTEKSKRLPEVNDLIDEKTMRWLELSEIEG